ncbi:AAA family ATPase [Enhygromyxa salina]|nr:ATP-binding protein [Enhygromyxa salina]
MLTRLEVDGFKSLRDFSVDLEPFTVFLGPNGAGKSNILEALSLLSRLATMPIVDAFKGGRGLPGDQFSRYVDERSHQIRFAAEFLLFGSYAKSTGFAPHPRGRFRYELVIARETRASGTEHLSASHELLRTMTSAEDTWVVAHPEFAELVKPSDEAENQFTVDRSQVTLIPQIWPEKLRPDPRRTLLGRDELQSNQSASVHLVADNLAACQWLRLDLAHLASTSDRVDTDGLRPDGSNLPTVLADLPPPLLGEIRASLVALVPGLSSVSVVPAQEALSLEFELSGGERVPGRLASDGTLRLLALLTALRLEQRPALIGIEEPENGIFPGRLSVLVELLRQEAGRKLHEEPGFADARLAGSGGAEFGNLMSDFLPPQILLTTHSPLLLAMLREHPEHLRFVDTVHRDRRRVTRVRKVGSVSADRRHLVVSPREIDELMNTVKSGGPP